MKCSPPFTPLFRKLSSAWIFCLLLAPLPAVAVTPCAISSNFNGTPIAGGNHIWFNSVFSLPGFDPSHLTSPLTINFTGVTITFSANSTNYTINAPDVSITYDPSNPPPTTAFTPGSPGLWTTVLPITHLSGNNFLDAVEFQVPAGGLPGGIHPVTWSGTFTSLMTGLNVHWQWGAAVYDTTFSTNYNALGVKPVDDNKASTYKNSDHAGTPENFKTHVRGGATGGGGSNYTGSYSGTGSCDTSIPPAIASCLPTSSLGVLVQGSTVTTYVPNGSWIGSNTGIQVVPIEPPGPATSIATTSVVNSCSSNSSTGQTVCVANNTAVYLITGTTLNTTLTSGALASACFSGGCCENCGVTINAVTNTAVITMGLTPFPFRTSGIQFLHLATNMFAGPFAAVHNVSEDILWDAGRNLILSPTEGEPGGGTYDLFDTSSATPVEYANSMPTAEFQEPDSACEDCLTGIALSTREFSNRLFLADLTQATFTPGSPGTWTSGAGQGFQTFPEFSGLFAGTCGIAVAPGSHLGIVTGEFGGAQFGVIQLPSTAGGMPPMVVDYAAATMPNDPDGNTFSTGCDPHTVTAYVNSAGVAKGLVTDYGATPCYAGGTPVWIAVIDLQGLLNAPRLPGTHTVSSIPAGVVTFVHD